MKMCFFSTKLRSSFFAKLQVSTAVMTFLVPVAGWTMGGEDLPEAASYSVLKQKSKFSTQRDEDLKKYIDIIAHPGDFAPFLKNIQHASVRDLFVISIAKDIPQAERTEFSKSMALALEGLDESGQYHLLHEISKNVPATERTDVVVKAAPVLKDFPYTDHRIFLISAINNISSHNRTESFSRNMASLISGITNGLTRHVAEAVENIPQEDRADVVEKAALLSKDISDSHTRTNLIWVIKEVPQAERAEFTKNMAFVLQGIVKIPVREGFFDNSQGELIREVLYIKKEERNDVLIKALPLLIGISDATDRRNIIGSVGTASQAERAEVLEKVKPFLQGASGNKIANLILAVSRIPQTDRADILEKATPLLNGIPSGYACYSLINTFKDIPQIERPGFLTNLTSALGGINNESQEGLLRIIEEVSPVERTKFLKKIASLLKNIPSGNNRAFVISTMRYKSQVDRVRILENMTSALGDIKDDNHSDVIRWIQTTPQKEMVKILEQLSPFLNGIPSGSARANLIGTVRGIPKTDREDVLKKAKLFLNDSTEDNGNGFAALVSVIGEIPQTERIEVLEKAKPMLVDVNSCKKHASILYAIHEIPKNERRDVLEKAKPFLQTTPEGKGRAGLLYAIHEIPKREREDVLKKVKLFLNDIPIGKELGTLVLIIGDLPQTEREEFLITLKSLLQDFSTNEVCVGVIQLLDLTPLDFRTQMVHFLKKVIKEDLVNFELAHKEGIASCFSFLFNLDENFKEQIISMWNTALSLTENPRMFSLSEFILDYADELGFSAEDQIMQNALRVSEILDPEMQ